MNRRTAHIRRSLLLCAATLPVALWVSAPASAAGSETHLAGRGGPTLTVLERHGSVEVRDFAINAIPVVCSIDGGRGVRFTMSLALRRGFAVDSSSGAFEGSETMRSNELNGVGRNSSTIVADLKGTASGGSARGQLRVSTRGVQLTADGRVVSECTSKWLSWNASS